MTHWVAASDVADPAWLPGGAGLAYSANEVLWRVSGPLAPPVRLISGPGSQPSCALGGTAYVRESHIWVFDGERERQLTFGPSHESSPAISSDAEWIAFVSDRGDQSDLWVISAGGGTPVRLTNDAAEDLDPSWSFNGQEIAFVSWRGGSPNIWLASDLPLFTIAVQQGTWTSMKMIFKER
jgi:Tol biopolymer transport system component